MIVVVSNEAEKQMVENVLACMRNPNDREGAAHFVALAIGAARAEGFAEAEANGIVRLIYEDDGPLSSVQKKGEA